MTVASCSFTDLRGNSLLPFEGEFGMELDLRPFFMLPAEPGLVGSSTTVHWWKREREEKKKRKV